LFVKKIKYMKLPPHINIQVFFRQLLNIHFIL